MALSLIPQQQQHHPSFLDLQTFFDPFLLQQRVTTTTTATTKIDLFNCNDFGQMEYNNSNQNHQHQHHNSNSCSNSSSNVGVGNSSGIINNGNNNNNSNQHQSPVHINQSQTYMSGYHHHHIGADYEQVINFVDSPPDSEESWTDEHSKESPGLQIIDVQTIYSNSGSRKRRMDWDSLDIGQSGNTATAASAAQSGEAGAANKITLLEKDKQKREKLTGRGSWSDEIGFDLNAEFNSNSYLNNEPFLAFSPALTVLKQEPQTDQLNSNKSTLNPQSTGAVISKIDKPSTLAGGGSGGDSTRNAQEKPKTDTNTLCGCGSPQSSQQGLEPNAVITETSDGGQSASGHGNAGSFGGNVDECKLRRGASIQQLTVVDASKIENSTNAATSHSDDHKFQYILGAATSIATKNNEETLTYLNQGQSYEIKLKKIGDLSFYRDKILKSVIKICFHERRLQFMEREQLQQWQASRPGERIIEVDVPLSYGLCHVSQPLNPNYLNTVEVFWDPLKEVGVYVKVNCISTEFTPKKHGGEKGVPFRLQIETYIENTSSAIGGAASPPTVGGNSPSAPQSPIAVVGAAAADTPAGPGSLTPTNNIGGLSASLISGKQPVHAAACQIKVFKLKGADRKHKQDREKIQKRPQSEQEKFQPSYECTIMNDIPLDLITPAIGCYSPEYMKIWPNSPVHIPKYDGILPYTSASSANSSPIAINSVSTTTNSPTLKLMDANMVSPQQVAADMDDYAMNIMPESTPAQVTQWLTNHRLTAYLSTFAHFSGSDIMRMSKEDLSQICGLADGIRMFNILRAKAITPRLTVYVSLDGHSYNAIYLISNTAKELTQKLFKLPGFYEIIANNANGALDNVVHYSNWGSMQSKYSGSGSNIFSDVSKSLIYVSGPSGVHVTVTDEVLSNEIKDGSLYTLEPQNGKVVLKLINKNDN